MRSVRGVRKGKTKCEHVETSMSLVAGLEREVCVSCGSVSFKRLSDSISKGGIPTPRYEVDTR